MLNSLWQFILAVITYYSVRKVGSDSQVIKQQQKTIEAIGESNKAKHEFDTNPKLRDKLRSEYDRSK
jgi:hypothetical protein